jgi:SpoVK/Ycf46/Vps4 family AAA+-type ATPase
VLPLVSEHVHKCLPIKTILFYGCVGSGKSMLAHAVASQTGSVFFDLSPSHFADKDALFDPKMLMHMVFKVAKTMAPAVLYIDQVENIFRKQKKKKKDGEEEDTGSPMRRYKKLLFTHLKQLQPGERVLLIGNSSNPGSGGKLMTAFFNKMIFVPLPDYSSRQILWSQLIAQDGGKMKGDTDVPSLAKISEGYSAGSVI